MFKLDEVIIQEILGYRDVGYSWEKIADVYGVSRKAITNNMQKFGYNTDSVRYNINHNFFNKIDTEWKAYWLGFIAADGSVRYMNTGKVRRYVLKIKLAIIDTDHLQKFLDVTESNHPIHIRVEDGREFAVIEICSPQMVEDLIGYGIVPNKVLILKPHLSLPLHLIRHYWRGLVDGDGTIFLNNPYPVIGLYGTHAVCNEFRKFCEAYINSNISVRSNRKTFQYTMQGRKAVIIIDQLYTGATIYLDRKYERAMEILEKFG